MRTPRPIMGRLPLALLLLTVLNVNLAAQMPAGEALHWVAEGGVTAAQRDGMLELKGGHGWLRLNSVFSDFILECDVQLPTDSSSASISIRSRPGYNRSDYPFPGYHLLLSNTDDFGRVDFVDVQAARSGPEVKTIRRPRDDWQHVRIEANLDVLRITLNGGPPMTLERLDEFAGYVAVRATKGRAAFRNMRVTRMPRPDFQPGAAIPSTTAAGLKSPTLKREATPFYPKEPQNAGIEGIVRLEAIVQQDGSVGDVRVTRARHPDLDEAAIAAVRKWQFIAGEKDGQPVPMLVLIELSFTRGQ
jgi:TonB family protein